MRARNQSVLDRMLEPEEGAIEQVVSRYQRVAPAVTRFARSLSGNDDLRVRLGSEPSSSAGEVVCDPRLFQAAYRRNAPVTPDEVALASALHEVIHLVSTDLDDRRPVPEDWPTEPGTAPAAPTPGAPTSGAATPGSGDDEPSEQNQPVELLDALQRAGGAAAEALFFTLEDARQERQGMAMYPGARSVLTDLYRAAFNDAMRAAGPFSQFVVACFLTCGGYAERERLERRLEARAAVALDESSDAIAGAASADDAWTVAGRALELLAIARANGLLTDLGSQATTAQQEAQEQVDADAAAEAVDRVRLTSPVVRDAESYTDTRRSSESRAGITERAGLSDVGADPSTDQLLRISEAPTVYLPTGQGGKVVVSPAPHTFARFAPEGRQALSDAAASWQVTQRHVSGELYPLFAANQRRGLRSGYDQGDVSPHAALFIGAGLYTRMYERRAARTRRRYAVSLLVDASASMLQSRDRHRGGPGWAMSAALMGAWTLARLADELQIDFEVALFNRSFAARPNDTEWTYTRSRSQSIAGLRKSQGGAADRLTSTVNHYIVKPFDRPWRDAEDRFAGMFWTATQPGKAAAAARRNARESPPVSMFDKASNVDEFNLVHAAERMARLGSQVRVLVVLADGMTRGSLDQLTHAVAAIERSGTTVLGIGIGDDTVETAYDRSEVVERPAELTRAMVDGVRSSLRRSLSLWGMDTWWSRSARPTGPGRASTSGKDRRSA